MFHIIFVTVHGKFDWFADSEPDIESIQEHFKFIYPYSPAHGIMAFCRRL